MSTYTTTRNPMPEPWHHWFELTRTGDWRSRVEPWHLAVLTAVLASVVLGVLIFHACTDRNIDFTAFYAAADLAAGGHGMAVYDPALLYQAERAAALQNPAFAYNCFLYPPFALVVLRPLSLLPYPAALALWTIAQFAAVTAILRRITGRLRPMIYLIAFPAIWYNVLLGQDGLLNTAILGAAALAFAGKRPGVAGGLMALLCYKPQLILVLPGCLLAGRQWRAITAFALGVCGLALLSLWLDGVATWRAFLVLFFHGTGAIYGTGSTTSEHPGSLGVVVHANTILSAYGFALTTGLGRLLAAMFQIVVSTGAVFGSAWIWRASPRLEPRILSLLASIALAAPLFMLYDATIYVLALAWVRHASDATGWPPWEASLFLVIYATSLSFGCICGVQLGWLDGLALLWIAYRRAGPDIGLRASPTTALSK